MIKRIFIFAITSIRRKKYSLLSNNKIKGLPIVISPILSYGDGLITVGNNVKFGVVSSPVFFTSYHYLDARSRSAKIVIGDDVWINNGAVIVAENSTITIRDKVLIGVNCHIVDSDFHNINSINRLDGTHKTKDVLIGKNVFIGNNVIILKGVIIGENSVVAAGSVVTKSFPENVVIGGNPAKIIKQIDVKEYI